MVSRLIILLERVVLQDLIKWKVWDFLEEFSYFGRNVWMLRLL